MRCTQFAKTLQGQIVYTQLQALYLNIFRRSAFFQKKSKPKVLNIDTDTYHKHYISFEIPNIHVSHGIRYCQYETLDIAYSDTINLPVDTDTDFDI